MIVFPDCSYLFPLSAEFFYLQLHRLPLQHLLLTIKLSHNLLQTAEHESGKGPITESSSSSSCSIIK
ncbi:hypothetical protein X975_23563, partial [Stegodyphus mimosarum]